VRRVLDAAMGELARSGYAGFRMDEVAARAGVNKTTIYRRWPTRAALVGALVERMREPLRDRPLPDTGQLERDLVEAFTLRLAVGRKVEGRAWARLLDERFTREVEAIIGNAVNDRRAKWLAIVSRAIERGEIPAGTDPELVLHLVRAIADARRLDEDWLVLGVRTVLAGARAGTLVSATKRKGARRRR